MRLAFLGAASLLALTSLATAQVNTEYRAFRRLMPGGTRAEIEAAQNMGFAAFLAQQLNPAALPDAEGDGLVGGPDGVQEYWPVVYQIPDDIRQNFNQTGDEEKVRERMRFARIWRWTYSEQGLFETLTWEWDRHFNIDQNKRAGWLLFPYWNRMVTRKHTLGQFRDMFHASAGDNADGASAMLHYLDNLSNRCLMPMDPVNENYSREVMELHGLGTAPQVYTETDVRNLAQILTGREFDNSFGPSTYGRVKFDPMFHCAQDLVFLGTLLPKDALTGSQGTAALDLIVDKLDPATGYHYCAEFIARKLVAAFLTDAVPTSTAKQALLDNAVASAVTAFGANGDISAMLQAILTASNIDNLLSGPNPPYKYMEPVKYVSSLLQAAEADLDETNMKPIADILASLAETPYSFPPPIGYPVEIEAWVQDQSGRWSFAYRLFEENTSDPNVPNCTIDGVSVDVAALYNQIGGFSASTCGAQVDRILTGGNMNARDVAILQTYANRILPTLPTGQAGLDELAWRVLSLGAMAPSFSLY